MKRAAVALLALFLASVLVRSASAVGLTGPAPVPQVINHATGETQWPTYSAPPSTSTLRLCLVPQSADIPGPPPYRWHNPCVVTGPQNPSITTLPQFTTHGWINGHAATYFPYGSGYNGDGIPLSQLVSATAFTVGATFRYDGSLQLSSPIWQNSPAVFTDGGQYVGLFVGVSPSDATALMVSAFAEVNPGTGNLYLYATTTLATGSAKLGHFALAWLSTGVLSLQVDAGAVTTALGVGNISNTSYNYVIGYNGNTGATSAAGPFTGSIAALWIANTGTPNQTDWNNRLRRVSGL